MKQNIKRLKMNKFLFLFALFLFLSCSKKRENENFFITKNNEYWDYDDTCQNRNIYFRFNKNGSWNRYNKDIFDGFEIFNRDGDLLSTQRTWSIKNDSIFVWDNEEYKIETCTKDSIILTYYHYEDKNRKCKVTLKKVIDK